jgi:hypothetical protein
MYFAKLENNENNYALDILAFILPTVTRNLKSIKITFTNLFFQEINLNDTA